MVKVGESLGETCGNFVGRLAATPAVLTPVIPAFGASVVVVHPVLPDRDHAAMLTMVKDGSWLGLAHRRPYSMGIQPREGRRRHLEAGRITRRRRRVFGEVKKTSVGETVAAAVAVELVYGRSRNSMPTSRSLRRKQWRERPNTICLDPTQSAIIMQFLIASWTLYIWVV